MIQPAGLGGSPSAGHRCTAVVNASATASSATSMSPKTRTRTATARPCSARNTRSISDARSGSKPRSVLGDVLERTHLDGQGGRAGRLARPPERRLEVLCIDDPEPADVLLTLDVRAVGGHHLPVADPDHGGRARGV